MKLQVIIGFAVGCMLMVAVFFNITSRTKPESAGQMAATLKVFPEKTANNIQATPIETTLDATITYIPETLTHAETQFTTGIAPDKAQTTEVELITEQFLDTTEKVDVFWGPFNSRGRAIKFAGYLQSLSKTPLIVVRKKYSYSIAFRYDSQQQQLATRQLLSKKSGLTLHDLNK